MLSFLFSCDFLAFETICNANISSLEAIAVVLWIYVEYIGNVACHMILQRKTTLLEEISSSSNKKSMK